jgi:hypothetical protein
VLLLLVGAVCLSMWFFPRKRSPPAPQARDDDGFR